jgi:transcriptional regulator
MYLPAHFTETDSAKIDAVIRANSFATLITFDGTRPFASHLPFLLRDTPGDRHVLIGHMARANPQWQHFKPDAEVLVVFTGPHAYVSPSWYKTPRMVPTWNYVAVHVYGFPRIVDGDQLEKILQATIAKYESSRPTPWTDTLPADLKTGLMKAIVGFEVDITRTEAKFKLNQNRSPEDIAGVVAALDQSHNQTERELAALMKSQYQLGQAS